MYIANLPEMKDVTQLGWLALLLAIVELDMQPEADKAFEAIQTGRLRLT